MEKPRVNTPANTRGNVTQRKPIKRNHVFFPQCCDSIPDTALRRRDREEKERDMGISPGQKAPGSLPSEYMICGRRERGVTPELIVKVAFENQKHSITELPNTLESKDDSR